MPTKQRTAYQQFVSDFAAANKKKWGKGELIRAAAAAWRAEGHFPKPKGLCVGVPQSDCLPPCGWANGAKRKYCHAKPGRKAKAKVQRGGNEVEQLATQAKRQAAIQVLENKKRKQEACRSVNETCGHLETNTKVGKNAYSKCLEAGGWADYDPRQCQRGGNEVEQLATQAKRQAAIQVLENKKRKQEACRSVNETCGHLETNTKVGKNAYSKCLEAGGWADYDPRQCQRGG
jgi:hypothetical protein